MVGSLARVAVFGDIHAEDQRLEAGLEFLASADVDLVVAVGDIVDGRGSVERTCELLQKHNVTVVAGNHERWLLADQSRDLPDAQLLSSLSADCAQYLRGLPRMVELSTVRGLALLCHGLGSNDMGGVWPDDYGYAIESNTDLHNLLADGSYAFVLNGHTHRRMIRRFGDLTILNAGTLVPEHEPGFLIVDFEAASVTTVKYQSATSLSTSGSSALP